MNSVLDALREVDDPEYPGVSIVDLGLLEDVRDDGTTVTVDLIPTMSGCPALRFIERDVTDAATAAIERDGLARRVEVRFLPTPVWTPDRITGTARQLLATEFTVAIRTSRRDATCPVCGGTELEEKSAFGPTPCRSVNWCASCRNPIEVVRR